MQICTWTELAQQPALRADEIEALQLTLGPGSLSHPAGTPGRKLNGLIAVTAGSCTYVWDTADGPQTATLTAGGLIYLPRGAHYTLTLGAAPPVICRVSFRLYSGDEELLCAADPMPIAADGGAAVQRCVQMCGAVGADRSLRAMAQLFALLDEIGRMTAQAEGRTAPALAHIRSHIDAKHIGAGTGADVLPERGAVFPAVPQGGGMQPDSVPQYAARGARKGAAGRR